MKLKICLIIISLFCYTQAFDIPKISDIINPDARAARWGQSDADIFSQENSADNSEYVETFKRKDELTGTTQLVMHYKARYRSMKGDLYYSFKDKRGSWSLISVTYKLKPSKSKYFDNESENIEKHLRIEYGTDYKVSEEGKYTNSVQWKTFRSIITLTTDFYEELVSLSFVNNN